MTLQSATKQLVFLAILAPTMLLADLADTQKLEQEARAGYVQRFLRFMQDKNVMGKARMPDGKVVRGGAKTQFNGDDGLSYKSDLTYHDFSYNTTEDEKGADGKVKKERLLSFVSSHGKDEASVGSSELERTVFKAHQAATKAEEDGKSEDQPEKGIRFQSIFKVTTREVKAPPEPAAPSQPGQGNANNPSQGATPDKAETIIVDRREITDNVRGEIERVGQNSSESILQSARDEDTKDDPNALGNGVLLRIASAQAAIAWDQSTAANLAQRRLNKGIRESSLLPFTPQLSEAIPNCDQFSQTVASKIGSSVTDPDQQKRLNEELGRLGAQCKELSRTGFDQIGPRFVRTEDGKGEVLKSVGVGQEDGIERDLRVQLQVLRKGGIDPNSVPNNWTYQENEKRARVSVVSDGGAIREEERTVTEQLDSYNNQIVEAQKGYEEVSTRTNLNFDPKNMDQYLLNPEEKSVADINQPPPSALEELGVESAPGQGEAPTQNYDELLERVRAD